MKKGFKNFVLGTMLISTIVSPIGSFVVRAEGVSSEIRAQDDFYGYVNAADLRNAERDPKYGYGSFEDCTRLADERLDELIDKIVKGDGHTSTDAKLIKDYYQQVLDYSGENSNADADLENVRKEIEGISSMQELMVVLGRYNYEYGVQPIKFGVGEGMFKSEEYSIGFEAIKSVLGVETKELATTEKGRSTLRDKARDILYNIGYDKAEASKIADDFTVMAVDIAYHSQNMNIEFDDIVYCNTDELKAKGFDIDSYARGYGIANPYDRWMIEYEEQFTTICEMLSDEKNLENFKVWLLLEYVSGFENYLSDNYKSLKNVFGEQTKSGDMLAKAYVKSDLEDSLGRLYHEAYYTKEKEDKVRAMCEDIRDSYRDLIGNADWLSQEGRDKLLTKLENIDFKIGGEYKDCGRSSESLIGADAYETSKNMIRFKKDCYKEDLKTKRPKRGAAMTPQTVNACFCVDNVVVVPVAIQEGAFFDDGRSEYANLGGLGMILAHEVGHAFDANCIKWDEKGNRNPEWLNEEDRKALEERSAMCIDYYGRYTIMDVYHVDGKLTLGENYADLGAIECISNIPKNKEDFKEMYESFARIYRSLGSDVGALTLLATDVHSPDRVRVNAPLSSCEKFYEAFDVKEGDGMYVSPDKRVNRW
ncbi:MAG: M13 family metallopeptidase [Eubacterium sp.]|nr:M13 family metallopeptidase [Eubacterium sp.]